MELPAHFWLKFVVTPAGCWQWLGSTKGNDGYGNIRIGATRPLAHRASYEALVGTIPKNYQIDHLCRNRACVNPAHLEPVTNRENQYRSPITHAGKDTCKHGHPFTPENTYTQTQPNGRTRRACRACRKVIDARRAWEPGRRELLRTMQRESQRRKAAAKRALSI